MTSTMTIDCWPDTAAASPKEEKQQFGPLALVPSGFSITYSKRNKYKLEIIADGKRFGSGRVILGGP